MRKSPIDHYLEFEAILSRDFVSAKDFLYRLRLKELSRQSDQSYPNWPLRRQYLKGQYSYEIFQKAFQLDQSSSVSYHPRDDKRQVTCFICGNCFKYTEAVTRVLKRVKSWKQSFRLANSEGLLVYLCPNCKNYNFILILDKIQDKEHTYVLCQYNSKGQISLPKDEINAIMAIISHDGIEIIK